MGPLSRAALTGVLLIGCGSAAGSQEAEPAAIQVAPAAATTQDATGTAPAATEPAAAGQDGAATTATSTGREDPTGASGSPPPGSERHGPFAGLPPTTVGLPTTFVAPPWPAGATPLGKGLLAGSWAPGEQGFDQAWVDESGLLQAFTNWRAGRRRWRGVTSKGDTLSVDVLIRDRTGPAIAYVFTLVQRSVGDPLAPQAPQDAQAVLHIRHRGRLRAWLDGRLVADAPAPPAGQTGLVQAPVVLSSLYDVLLLKLGRGSEALGDSMDVDVVVTDLQGRPFEGQTWNTMRSADLPSDLQELGIQQGQR